MNFTIPGLTGLNFLVNIKLIKLLKEHDDLFNNNISITTIHGGFDGLAWGTEIGNNFLAGPDVEWILRVCQMFNINVRLNLNSTSVKQNNMQDDFAHAVARLYDRVDMDNQVEVSTQLVEDTLKTAYYNYKYVSASNKIITEFNELTEASKKYDIVSINSRVNAKKEMLLLLPDKEKFEITLNCFNTMPNDEHDEYFKLRSNVANMSITAQDRLKLAKIMKINNGYASIGENQTTISNNELEMLSRMGFTNFKLEAGDTIFDTIESYLYYFVKDEFKDIVRQELLDVLVKEGVN